MTEDIQTPEILATVGRFDYITGVLKRPHDGGPARFYSTIAAWETTEAFYAAGMERQLADMQRDRNAAEKKVGELLLRSQEQEGAIATLQRQLLEAKAPSPAEAPLPPWPAAAPAAHDEPRARGRSSGSTRADCSERPADPALAAAPEAALRCGRLREPDGDRHADGDSPDAPPPGLARPANGARSRYSRARDGAHRHPRRRSAAGDTTAAHPGRAGTARAGAADAQRAGDARCGQRPTTTSAGTTVREPWSSTVYLFCLR